MWADIKMRAQEELGRRGGIEASKREENSGPHLWGLPAAQKSDAAWGACSCRRVRRGDRRQLSVFRSSSPELAGETPMAFRNGSSVRSRCL